MMAKPKGQVFLADSSNYKNVCSFLLLCLLLPSLSSFVQRRDVEKDARQNETTNVTASCCFRSFNPMMVKGWTWIRDTKDFDDDVMDESVTQMTLMVLPSYRMSKPVDFGHTLSIFFGRLLDQACRSSPCGESPCLRLLPLQQLSQLSVGLVAARKQRMQLECWQFRA